MCIFIPFELNIYEVFKIFAKYCKKAPSSQLKHRHFSFRLLGICIGIIINMMGNTADNWSDSELHIEVLFCFARDCMNTNYL